MQKKEHLTLEGLHRIVAIKAVHNRGLTDKLKAAFTDILPHVIPEKPNAIDPN